MHPAILATAGYGLLFSSLVSFVILLRKNVKRCIGSSLHMLTMSDIVSSFLTGVLLIYNQNSQPLDGPFGNKGVNDTTGNLSRFQFVNSESDYPRMLADSWMILNMSENVENIYSELTSSCDFRQVVMHYAMFLFPFANAFISLLSFSTRCNVDLNHVSSKCRRLIVASGSNCNNNEKEESCEDKFDCLRKKSEMKITGLGIASQWIIPMLLTVVLQFAGHEKLEDLKSTNDMGCVYGTNFPFENCYGNSSTRISSGYFIETQYTTPTSNDYMISINSSRISEVNSTNEEISDVVSKIYQIIESAVNSTGNETDVTKISPFYDVTKLLNITKFIDVSTVENNEETTTKLVDAVNDTSEVLMNEETGSASNMQEEMDPNEESQLFESLLRNSSNFFNDTIYNDEDTELEEDYNPTSLDIHEDTQSIVELKEPSETVLTDEEIHADIIKKIQAVSTQLRQQNKNRPLRKNVQMRSQKNINNSDDILLIEEHLMKIPVCMKKQCFMSISFLKIHLVLIVFLIYCLPILISAILHTRTRYMCQNIKENLAMTERIRSYKKNVNKEHSEERNLGESKDQAGFSGWFAAGVPEGDLSASSSEDLVCAGKIEKTRGTTAVVIEKNRSEESSIVESMKTETQEVEKLSDLFKTSFLAAIVLWTPVFLELLAKVFFCVNLANWLMNSSFFGAALFGIVRNILNMRMIETGKTIRDKSKINNNNSVYPSS